MGMNRPRDRQHSDNVFQFVMAESSPAFRRPMNHKPSTRAVPGLVASVMAWAAALSGCGGGGSSSPSQPPGSTSYTIGGNVSGLAPAQSVTLINNAGNALTVITDGNFTFSTRQNTGTAYAVTVQSQSTGIACSVGNGTGSVGTSNVTNVSISCAPGTLTIIHSFGGTPTDGTNPQAGLITDNAGNFYGTTYSGGAIGGGTVFKISATGTETVLHSFTGFPSDGANPRAGLVMDDLGNLYGTTSLGGASDRGTVFKIDSAGVETILHSFDGTYGGEPLGALVIDNDGNLYGTASGGGNGNGTVFRISAAGTISLVHAFRSITADDGRYPHAGLTFDAEGNLYGTTFGGGTAGKEFGTVFKVSTDGTESVVYSFGGVEGSGPAAPLLIDSTGSLYGTTTSAGSATTVAAGVAFKIDEAAQVITILHYFVGGITPEVIDAGEPRAGLIFGNTGNLYGTTLDGGEVNEGGTVFELSMIGELNMLHSFGGGSNDGHAPMAGLVMDNSGRLYGTTVIGGAYGGGVVFRID